MKSKRNIIQNQIVHRITDPLCIKLFHETKWSIVNCNSSKFSISIELSKEHTQEQEMEREKERKREKETKKKKEREREIKSERGELVPKMDILSVFITPCVNPTA
jgi:hypothetical protein